MNKSTKCEVKENVKFLKCFQCFNMNLLLLSEVRTNISIRVYLLCKVFARTFLTIGSTFRTLTF